MSKTRKITGREAEEIRAEYAAARSKAHYGGPDDWETSAKTEKRLADYYGTSPSNIRSIVRGLTHSPWKETTVAAKGAKPVYHAATNIDYLRLVKHKQYEIAKARLGADKARELVRDPTSAPPALSFTVIYPDDRPNDTYILPPGAGVVMNYDQHTEPGVAREIEKAKSMSPSEYMKLPTWGLDTPNNENEEN